MMSKKFIKMLESLEKSKNDFLFFTDAFSQTSFEFPKKEDSNYVHSEEVKETKDSIIVTEKWTSLDESSYFTRTTVTPKKREMSDAEIKESIRLAVEKEDYETAAQLKKLLDKKLS